MLIPKKPLPSPEALEAFISGGTATEGAEFVSPTATVKTRKKPIRQKERVLRQTFVMNEDLVVNRLEPYAFWQRMTKKAVLEAALEAFFAGKKIKAIPRQ